MPPDVLCEKARLRCDLVASTTRFAACTFTRNVALTSRQVQLSTAMPERLGQNLMLFGYWQPFEDVLLGMPERCFSHPVFES